MKSLAYFLLLLLLTAATAIQQQFYLPSLELSGADDGTGRAEAEAEQRIVFLLQYLASDYDRAVQHGQIIDSLEYGEMQRFSQQAAKSYAGGAAIQAQTREQLQALTGLIAQRASLPQIRQTCAALTAAITKEKNLLLFPQLAPNLDNGKALFRENCVSCHGLWGRGDGAAADTLKPPPRDFTDPARLNVCTPLQFYQAVTFGVEGTAMPAFAEAFTPEQRWDLAFYLMTLRRDFQALAPAVRCPLTLRQLATKNNLELTAILAQRQRLQRPDSTLLHSTLLLESCLDACRQNPPSLTMYEHLALAEKKLQQSLRAHLRADSAQAIQLAEEGYWLGFEPIESKLFSRVYLKFERAHTEYHWCLEEKGPPEQARAYVKTMLAILQHIRSQQGLRR